MYRKKVYYVKDDIYDLGKTETVRQGVSYAIYDRERTICDVFKYRGKFVRKINTKTDDFERVIKTIEKFLEPAFFAVMDNLDFNEQWSVARNEWRKEK